ncbi:MAG: hypothetical protein AAFY81_06660 [Pseudomonadota bacterium]
MVDVEQLHLRERQTIEALSDEQREVIMRRLGDAKALLQERSAEA